MKINNILDQVRYKGSIKAETQVELAEALGTTQPVIKHIIKNIIKANQNGYIKPKKGADYRDFIVITGKPIEIAYNPTYYKNYIKNF